MPTNDPTRAWWPESQATVGGADAPKVIEYTREQDICTGIGTLDYTISGNETPPGMWDEIDVDVMGALSARYNVLSIEKKAPDGVWLISCQDDSIRLMDYFITEQYEITYPSNSVYWLEKFLEEAGVIYELPAAYGVEMSENTSLGMTTAYDVVMQLCQMNGWAFHFELVDGVSTCIIGKFSITEATNGIEIKPNRVTELGYNKSDKMLRNRAVVWGAGDPDTGEWVYADTATQTAWNRPGNDYRTIVYSNSAIKTFGVAYSLASKILNEFSQTIPEKHINGFYNYDDWWNYDEWRICTDAEILAKGYYLHIMTPVKAYSEKHHIYVSGRITHITENMSKDGGITFTYILDRRCPRLFGYAEWLDYVYIGTNGAGVWRKWITSSTWVNYSTGITDLNIKDLSAYNGLLATIGSPNPMRGRYGGIIDDSYLYIRQTQSAAWSKYNPGGFTDTTASGGPVFLSSGYMAEACSIDRTYGINGMVTVGYTIPNPSGLPLPSGSTHLFPASGNLSWVQGVTADRVPVYTQQIILTSGTPTIIPTGVQYPNPYDIGIVDMDTNWDGTNIISVYNAQKVLMEMGPIYSGHMPLFDYGTFTRQPYGSSPTGIVSQPPPTSGIVVEQISTNTNIMPDTVGYRLLYVSTGDHGGCILTDDMEYDGRAYGCSLWGSSSPGIYKYKFHLSSGTSNWYTLDKYLFSGDYYLGGPASFYKVDENHFTIIECDIFAPGDHDNGEYSYGYSIAINESTGYADTTPLVTNQLSHHFSSNGDWMGDIDVRYSGDRYLAVAGNNTDHGPWLAVIDASDNTVIYNNSSVTGPGGYIITGFGSANHMIFGFFHSPGVKGYFDGGGWAGAGHHVFKVASVNVHTGAVNIGSINVQFPFPDGGWGGNVLWGVGDSYNNYHQPGVSLVYENIDSGVGMGHYYWIGNYELTFGDWYPAPQEHFNYTYFIDALIDSEGNFGSYTTYYDIWPAMYFGSKISGNIPSWVQHNNNDEYFHTHVIDADSMHYETLNSRNPSDTFGVFWRGAWDYLERGDFWFGKEHDLVIANPYDAGDVFAVLDSLAAGEYGSPYTRVAYEANPRLDDFDNTIYTSCVGWYDGENPVMAGYDSGGNMTKLLYPVLNYSQPGGQQEVVGTTAQDKIVTPYTSAIAKIWMRVPVNIVESGKENLQSRYLLLRHDPEVVPSGLFTVIRESTIPMYVDTSKSIPTTFYSKPHLDDYSSSVMGTSFLNEEGSFTIVSPGGGMGTHDTRVFDLDNIGGMFPVSGYMTSGFLDRYVGVAGGKKGLIMYPADLGGGGIYNPNLYTIIFSGAFTHLDFTNNDPDPYMFVCTSGTSSGSGVFYQRDKESLFWHDYSSTLPSGVFITIIRADDRM